MLPTFRCLLSLLLGKEHESSIIKKMKTTISDGLKTRMSAVENKRLKFLCAKNIFLFCLSFLKIATLLDPRYKNHPSVFPNVVERAQNRTLLITENGTKYFAKSSTPTFRSFTKRHYNNHYILS